MIFEFQQNINDTNLQELSSMDTHSQQEVYRHSM